MPLECFLDESSWQETNTYLIGIIAIEEAEMAEFESEMQEILDFAQQVTGSPTAEIHAQEIFGGQGCYRGINPYDRVLVFRKVIDLLARRASKICIKPINIGKARYASDPDHILALAWACEHIEKTASSSWRVTSDHHPQLNGRIIQALGDARRSSVRNCIKFAKLTQDSPIILHSNQSLGIQACDTALFTIGRYLRDKELGKTGESAREIRRLFRSLCNSQKLLIKNHWP